MVQIKDGVPEVVVVAAPVVGDLAHPVVTTLFGANGPQPTLARRPGAAASSLSRVVSPTDPHGTLARDAAGMATVVSTAGSAGARAGPKALLPLLLLPTPRHARAVL